MDKQIDIIILAFTVEKIYNSTTLIYAISNPVAILISYNKVYSIFFGASLDFFLSSNWIEKTL